MKIALDIVAGLLALAALASAVGKLKKTPDVVKTLTSVGVTPQQIPLLAGLEILGALGLAVGIWSKPLAVAASIGFVAYFLGAVASHVRAKGKFSELIAPGALMLLAFATVILELHR